MPQCHCYKVCHTILYVCICLNNKGQWWPIYVSFIRFFQFCRRQSMANYTNPSGEVGPKAKQSPRENCGPCARHSQSNLNRKPIKFKHKKKRKKVNNSALTRTFTGEAAIAVHSIAFACHFVCIFYLSGEGLCLIVCLGGQNSVVWAIGRHFEPSNGLHFTDFSAGLIIHSRFRFTFTFTFRFSWCDLVWFGFPHRRLVGLKFADSFFLSAGGGETGQGDLHLLPP